MNEKNDLKNKGENRDLSSLGRYLTYAWKPPYQGRRFKFIDKSWNLYFYRGAIQNYTCISIHVNSI